MGRWVKLYTDITKNKIFKNALLLKLFIYCLSKANYEECDWRDNRHLDTIHLMPGEFISSYQHIANDIGCSRSAVVRWAKQLEKDGCLTIKGNTHYTRFSLVNWALYQGDEKKVNNSEDNRRTTDEQQTDNRRTQLQNNKNIQNKEKERDWASPFTGDFMG